MSFGTDTKMVEKVVQEVKKCADKPLIVKLSQMLQTLQKLQKAAVSGGADGLSLINTLTGMKIDIYKRQPVYKEKLAV